MADVLPQGSKLQHAVACELDAKVYDNTVNAAKLALEAKKRAEIAAKALENARIVQEIDDLAFNQREIDINEAKPLCHRYVQVSIYFASWSKMKERHYHERAATGSSEAVTLRTEREFVTRLAGDALMKWDWLGRLDWCNLPREASDSRTIADLTREVMESRNSMMKTLNAFYRSQDEFDLTGVEFILRSPSFNLVNQGLNDFLRELIDGATIVLKLKLPLRPVRTCLSQAVAKILGLDSLPCRALDVGGYPTLGDAATVAFWKVLPVGTVRHLCTFLPRPDNLAASLRDLANYHSDRAKQDAEETENILKSRGKKARMK